MTTPTHALSPVPLVVHAHTGYVYNKKTDYIKLGNEEDTVQPGSQFYTKYDYSAIVVMVLAILTFISWIIYIIINFAKYGLTTAYCREPLMTCDQTFLYSITPDCCINGGVEKTCWDNTAKECHPLSHTTATTFIQFILICLLISYIYVLVCSMFTGITIIHPNDPKHPLMEKLMKYKEYIIYDCRRNAYRIKETPQKTALDLFWNGLVWLSVARLVKDTPIILINMYSGDITLKAVGWAKLWADIVNIFQNLWASVSPICNPCRGQCCGDKCCCDCCFLCIGCRCTFGHFPQQHEPFVKSIGGVVFYSNMAKIAAAMVQCANIAYIDSTTEWHLWLSCLNFVLGVTGIVSGFKGYWRYYYLLCFYWSRWAVNKHENYKIQQVLNDMLRGEFIFRVKVEKEDQFVTVLNTENIAEKVKIKWDCWVFWWIIRFFLIISSVAIFLMNYTHELNVDFNLLNSRYLFWN